MRVLALDPGNRVGWARADVSHTGEWSDLRHGITPLRDMAIAVHDALDPAYEPSYNLVVCESWRLYAGMAQQFIGSTFPSVQFIGMVKLCCWVGGVKFIEQGASIKKDTLPPMAKLDPVLFEKVTRGVRHDDGHDQDALIHLWRHCWKSFPEFKGSGLSVKEAA